MAVHQWVGQGSALTFDPPIVDVLILVPRGAELNDCAVDLFRNVFVAHPECQVVYCDHELSKAAEWHLVPLTSPDEWLWAQGARLPQCVAFRKHWMQAQRFLRQPIAGILAAATASPGSVRHLPLPLCRLCDETDWGHGQPAPVEQTSGLDVRLSIIIPTRDGGSKLEACMKSIQAGIARAGVITDISIVDNGSRDPKTLGMLDAWRVSGLARVLRYDVPFNFSAINNWAVEQTDGDLLLLLNDDIEALDADWLSNMLDLMRDSRVGVVGCELLYPDGAIQHCGIALGLGGVAEHPGKRLMPSDPRLARWITPGARRVSAVTGACLLTRRGLYCDLGGLNEHDLPVAFNDVDYCLRVGRHGWQVLCTTLARLIHHESVSRGAEDSFSKHQRFCGEIAYMKRTWSAIIADDPNYSPHLSLHASDLSFRNPPSLSLAESRAVGAADIQPK